MTSVKHDAASGDQEIVVTEAMIEAALKVRWVDDHVIEFWSDNNEALFRKDIDSRLLPLSKVGYRGPPSMVAGASAGS